MINLLYYKIPEISLLATTTVLNTKISVENKIPDVSALATTAVLNKKTSGIIEKILDVRKPKRSKKQIITLK